MGFSPEGSASKISKVKFNGKTVIQDNNLFDPNFIDDLGDTNIIRMEKGKAPIGTDGKSINLHHIDQTEASDLIELTKTTHSKNYSVLHENRGQSPSLINRKVFNKYRTNYWKNRAIKFK